MSAPEVPHIAESAPDWRAIARRLATALADAEAGQYVWGLASAEAAAAYREWEAAEQYDGTMDGINESKS